MGKKSIRRYGWSDKHKAPILCIVTGEMVDGTKIWTECDESRNLIDPDTQYTLQTRGDWSEFVRF